jgi:hypothetical protein
MKKIIKFVGFGFLGVLLSLILIPYVYRDKIIILVKEALNDELNAKIDFDDVNLSLIKSFPKARLTVSNLSIIGIDTFENIELLRAKTIYLTSDISPLFKKNQKLSVKYLSISDANINIIKLDSLNANYLIVKESEDTSGFNLVLDGYELNNSNITYKDNLTDIIISAQGVNHKGKGNLSSEVFLLDTETTASSLKVIYEKFTYLNEVNALADLKINVDLPNEKYTFDNAKVQLNKLALSGNGMIDFNGDDMYIKSELASIGQSFENFVSALPFIENKKEYTARGLSDIKVSVEGIYNGLKSIFPSFDISINVKDGFLQYKGLDYPISPINASVAIKAKDPYLKDLSVDVSQFNFGINKEVIEGKLKIDKASTSPSLDGHIKGSLKLENWRKSFPMDNVYALSGLILSDIKFNGRLDDIQKQAYDKIIFDGKFAISNLYYQAKDSPKLKIKSMSVNAKPSKLDIVSDGIQLENSELSLSGYINNPLHFFLKDGNLNGMIDLKSDYLNLDEFNTGSTASQSNSSDASINLDKYKTSNIALKMDVAKMIYDKREYQDIKVDGKLGLNAIDINTLGLKVDDSDIAVNGKISNIYNFMTANESLFGKISLSSNYLDLNQFMTEGTSQDQSEGVLLIPANLDLSIQTSIKKLLYTNYTLSNLVGNVIVSNSEARLEGIDTEVLGGNIHFDGLYNTSNVNKPTYNLKLALDKIKIEDAYNTFVSMKALAPVSKYIKGFLNTTLIMSGSVTENMTPEFSDINAEGFIETIHSTLQNLTIFDKIADKLGIEALKKIDFGSSKNWFNIEKGTVELKEKTLTASDIGMKISGTHKINGDMNYDLVLKVPRSKIANTNIGGQIDKGFTWIGNEAKKRGLNIDQGEFIDLKIDITGRLLTPELNFTVLGSSGKTMAQEVSDEIKFQIDKATDSLKQILVENKDKLEDSIRTRLTNELEDAKEKVMSEAEKRANDALNSVKTEVNKEIESRIDSTLKTVISDSLQKKAEEILKTQTGEEVKEIKKKIEEFNPFKKKKKVEGN